jgi:hypothetical protein
MTLIIKCYPLGNNGVSTKDEDSCIILMRFHHPFVLHLVSVLYLFVVVANDWVPESIEQQGALEEGLENYYLPDL